MATEQGEKDFVANIRLTVENGATRHNATGATTTLEVCTRKVSISLECFYTLGSLNSPGKSLISLSA